MLSPGEDEDAGTSSAAAVNGEAVYATGTGAAAGNRIDGKLTVEGNEVKIDVLGHGTLTPQDFTKLAGNKYRRPKNNIFITSTGETLTSFEERHGYGKTSFQREWDDEGRDDEADYERRRILQKTYERERRRKEKEEKRNRNPEKVVPLALNPYLPAGAWAAKKNTEPPAELGEEEMQRVIDKGHKIWKKNVPLLYDLAMIQSLECPSLTVQWLPDKAVVTGGLFCEHRLLLGSFSGLIEDKKVKGKDYLMVGVLTLPRDISERDMDLDFDSQKQVDAGTVKAQMELQTKLPHDGEVNRARYMPQQPNLVATKAGGKGGEMYIFDLDFDPSTRPRSEQNLGAHQFSLRGHKKEGYGLSWSKRKTGFLLSGAYDKRICVWDVNAAPDKSRTGGRQLEPLVEMVAHADAVGDVEWHPYQENTFASVGDDRVLKLWDLRECHGGKAVASHVVSSESVNSLDFNHINQHLLATASGTEGRGTVCVWDFRMLSAEPLQLIQTHTDVVEQVSWAPHSENLLSSLSVDRKIHIIDISKAPSAGRKGNAADSDPKEVLFVHAGHTSKPSDLSWNQHDPWLVASVSELESTVQVWQMAEAIRVGGECEVSDSDNSSYDSDDLQEITAKTPRACDAAKSRSGAGVGEAQPDPRRDGGNGNEKAGAGSGGAAAGTQARSTVSGTGPGPGATLDSDHDHDDGAAGAGASKRAKHGPGALALAGAAATRNGSNSMDGGHAGGTRKLEGQFESEQIES